MGPGPVQFGDDVRDRISDARDAVSRPSSIRTWSGMASSARLSAAREYALARYGLPPRSAVRCAYSRRSLATVWVSAAGTQCASSPGLFCREASTRATVEKPSLRPPSHRASTGWFIAPPSVERLLKPLRRPKLIQMLQVRAACGLLGEQVVHSPYHDLQVLHPSARHRASLANGSDRVGTKIVNSVRHRRLNTAPEHWFLPCHSSGTPLRQIC